MVERRRLANTTPMSKPRPVKRHVKATTALFVCLPKDVLKYPPIAHRGMPAQGLLSVFECALATGIVVFAHQRWSAMRYRRSLKAGRAAVSDRQEIGATVARAQRAHIEYDFKAEMAAAYFDAHMNAVAPETIDIMVSKSALLLVARLSRNGRNQARLDAALTRLRSPVRAGRRELPPLLIAIKRLPSNRLQLTVDGQWLPRVIGVVPLPVPTTGNCANALALFLFLFGTDQRPDSRTNTIAITALCQCVGIAATRPAHMKRAIEGALKAVNHHLAKTLDPAALVKAKLPVRFDLAWLEQGERVRFEAIHGGAQAVETDMFEAKFADADQRHDEDHAAEMPREQETDQNDGPTDYDFRRWNAMSLEEQEQENELDEIRRKRGDWAARRARLVGA